MRTAVHPGSSRSSDQSSAGTRSHPWRRRRIGISIYLLSVAVGAVAVFFGPAMMGGSGWLPLGDYKWTIESAQYVTYGGLGHIYSANVQFLPLPGYLLLLAPAVALGDHLGFVSPLPFPMLRPSMWLVGVPVMLLFGCVAVLGTDYLADALGVSRPRRVAIDLVTGFGVALPTCCWAGHPEDTLCLGLAALALGLQHKGRHIPAAAVLALAVMMQPWALLLIPIVVMAAPAPMRVRVAACACTLPAVTGMALLGLDFHDAFRSLVIQPMQGNGQHLPWWNFSHRMTVYDGTAPNPVRVGSAPRLVAVVMSLLGGVMVWRNPTRSTVMLAASIALAARGIFETQVWCYYLGPAAVLLMVTVASAQPEDRRRWLTGAACSFTFYGFAAAGYDGYSMPSVIALLIMLGAAAGAVTAACGLAWAPIGLQSGRRALAREARTPLTNRPESSVL